MATAEDVCFHARTGVDEHDNTCTHMLIAHHAQIDTKDDSETMYTEAKDDRATVDTKTSGEAKGVNAQNSL